MDIQPFSRKVFYYKTDRMGIVHHSNYIRWMEETRIYWLEQAGMPFDVIESKGVMMPVLSTSFEYKLPFTFNDRFFITCEIPEFHGSRFSVNYVVKGEDGLIHGTGTSSHCFTDKSMRPIRVKKSHPEIYDAFVAISNSSSEVK